MKKLLLLFVFIFNFNIDFLYCAKNKRKRVDAQTEQPTKRARKSFLYDPGSEKPFRISRSKIDLFLQCPRCFYLDRRLGIKRPPGYPFTLNNAVDELLKKEFDIYREKREKHPLCIENEIDAIPFKHEDLDGWRDSLHKGIEYEMPETNLKITGGIDDVWINLKDELIVVDYKATSKKGEVSLDADWQIGYKRQVEIYQWLFRQNGFKVSNTAYFVYCNAKKDVDRFDGKLKFNISVIPYEGNDSWVDGTVMKIYDCLQSDDIPEEKEECAYCKYTLAVCQNNNYFEQEEGLS